MWRAFFSAVGIVLLILGIECLLIDSATLSPNMVDEPIPVQNVGLFGAPQHSVGSNRVIKPAEYVPWSLLMSGAVVLLYSISLRRNG